MTWKWTLMTTSVVIILLLAVVTDSASKDPFGKQPRISVEDGNLVLRGGDNKNITISSSGSGKILMDNVDVSSLIPSVQTFFGNTTMSAIRTIFVKLRRLEQMLGQLSGVVNDMEELRNNVTRLTSRIEQVRSSGSQVSSSRFRALYRKVNTLDTQVQKLTEHLTEDNCASNPCRHGGTCVDVYNGYICRCPSNWEGGTCEDDVNECARFAGTSAGCQNGAICLNTNGGYSCQCATNWYGVHCTESHDDCSSASHIELCAHGTCINEKRIVPGQPKYRCICDEGWTKGTGPACDQDVDECAGNTHSCSKQPPVACINLPGTFACGHCPSGYSGNGYTCQDINECMANNGGCFHLVSCINTIGSRQCGPCPAGYVGNGMHCSYVGVCNINRGGCHQLATCVENSAITGTFRECRCPPGYAGNGEGLTGCVQSQTSTTCSSNPCVHGTCQMTSTSSYCVCFPGFTGSLCDQQANPCTSQPCQNGGTCASQGNTYTCTCAENFEGPTCSQERQSCGGYLVGLNGSITYPPTIGVEYRHRENCAWVIHGNETQVLNITLTAIHIEQGPNCVFDFLQIHDGGLATSRPLRRFCGIDVDIGTTIQSTHSEVYVWFHSDHSISGYGFTITWNATNSSCYEVLDPAPYGAITSPGYPGNYPRNRDCYWHVRADPGKRIQLHFATLRLEEHVNCSFDSLTVYDGSRDTDPVLSRYCTTVTPPPLTTSGSDALLYFHSDKYIEDTGFHIAYSAIPSIQGCGGILTSPTGSVSSPNFPDAYDRLLSCEWLIRIHPDSRIHLTFQNFAVESHSSCRFDYVEVYDGSDAGSPLLGRFCGAELPPDVLSNGNVIFIKFYTDASVQRNGFKATYRTICGGTYTELEGTFMSPYFPDPYPSRITCYYFIKLPLGHLIHLKFPIFALERSSSCSFDYIQVRDGATEQSPLIGRYCGSTPPDPIVSSYNELLLTFNTDGSISSDGFFANYTSIPLGCGGILSGNRGHFSTPAHPNFYPPSVTCNWIIKVPAGHVIRLTFDTFVLEQHTDCEYDYVLVKDSDGSKIGKFCGITVPPMLTSTDNEMQVTFVADATVFHAGFNASYVALDASQTCGGEYYLESGVVRSPGFPNSYPHSRRCIWVLHAENGHQIILNATSFHLEEHTDCSYDYLEIRNGGSAISPLVGRYCGETFPSQLVSHSNVLYLLFASDSSWTGPGFEIYYDSATTGCGGTLKTPSGSIISPNYPQPYGHNAQCTWHIRVSKGSAISIVIVDADIEEHLTCQYDYLEIFDGDSDNARSLTRMCNNRQNPGPLRSSRNVLVVKFITDLSTSGRGFHLTYHSICNNELTKHRGVIESPNFPNPYPHNSNCTWTIRAPMGNNITLSFSHLFMEHSSSCSSDYIEVNETAPKTLKTKQLVKYCGTPTTLPPAIRTGTNIATVRFLTDGSVSQDGFRLEYMVEGCGGEIMRSYGFIESPNFPDSYPVSTECIWHIKYKPGSRVSLRVTDLGVEWATDCIFDYLKVYGGEDATAPLLLNLCHSITQPTTVTSHGNEMYIHFYSDSTVVRQGFRAIYSEQMGGCGGSFTAQQSTIASPSHPSPYNFNDECGWYIEVDKERVVVLEFYEFSLPSAVNCTKGYVAVYDGLNTNKPLLAKLCGEMPHDPIISATGNQMMVLLKADGQNVAPGFRAHYSAGCGRRAIADNGGEITTPNYPHIYHSESNCSWVISASDPGEKVTLIFTYMFVLAESCTYYSAFIEVRDGEHNDSPLIGHYCGREAPPPITSRGNALHIATSKDVIFRAVFGVTSSYCGGSLESESGSFSSPGFPDNYPMDSDCEWTIVASAGNKVQVSFRSFSLLQSDYCNMDYVEIHENDVTGPLIGRYCGNRIPDNVTAAHKLWIKFRSDESSTAAGFMAYYSLLHGNELNGTEGIIESPGYPKLYHQGASYQWLVTVPQYHLVSVRFLDLYMAPTSSKTCRGSLKVFDGSDATAPELGDFCGFLLPEAVVSHGSQVLIQYSDTFLRGKWRIQWAAVNERTMTIDPPSASGSSCFHEIFLNSSEPVEFTSPGYPSPSSSRDTNCTWMITSPPYERVKTKFLNISTQGNEGQCYYDKIEVYTAPIPYVDSWVLNSTLCGRIWDRTIESPSSFMKLLFTTNNYWGYHGFHAVSEPVCGGHLWGNSGHLRSSDLLSYISYHQSISSGFTCEWIITVRTKRTIQMTFHQFNLPSDTVCSNMYIMLLNGGRTQSPLLGKGKYCGTTEPVVPETSSNQVFVRLQVNSFTRGSPQFELRFTEISVACGGHFYINEDTPIIEVKSPSYPSPPPHPMECTWIIMSPQGSRMRVDFDEAFHMSSECYYGGGNDGEVEYVELLDGGTEFAEPIHRFCGNEHPSSQFTSGNALYLTYLTSLVHPSAGFKATIHAATCGGTIAGQYSGHLHSPNYPGNYSNSIECEWILKSRSSYDLRINIVFLDIPRASNCSLTDYLEIRSENSQGELKGRFCGQLEDLAGLASINMGTNTAYLKFKSDTSLTGTGFNLFYSTGGTTCGERFETSSGAISSPNYPAPLARNAICYWRVTAPLGRVVTISFTDFNLPTDETTGACLSTLMMSNSSYFDSRSSVTVCGNELPESTDSSGTTLALKLRSNGLAAGQGFSLTFTTDKESACGGVLSIPSGVITTGNLTLQNHTFIECLWGVDTQRENTTIAFKFDVFDIPGSVSTYCRDASFDMYQNYGLHFRRMCGNLTARQLRLTSPFRETSLRFISYPGLPRPGIHGTYTVNECGGVVVGTDAVITSPGYPDNYPPNIDCHWMVYLPYGETLQFTTVDMRLEDNCNNDYVLILDGFHLQAPVLGRFCGTSSPAPIIADRNRVTIIFHSNDYGTAPGFKITTSEVQQGCGGLIHAASRTIISPNYPRRYDNNVECVWTIEFSPGNIVNLTFIGRFDIETSEHCNNDYILLEDYDDGEWREVGKKCGSQTPTAVLSSSTKIRITFHTNSQIQGDGFKIALSAACGGHFNEPRGTIFSPNYPQDYDSNRNCHYLIGDPQHYVSLKFNSDKFDLEYNANCVWDYVNMYMGNTTSATKLGPYCGQEPPAPMLLLGQVLVEFNSDYAMTSTGFVAEYEVTECGGVRTDVFGRINTPRTVEKYLNRMDCTWVIQGLENRVIALRFTMFKLEYHSSCSFDYLAIYDSNSTYGEPIAKLCGHEMPPIVKSTSNQMTIRFKTDSSVTYEGFDAHYYNTYGVNQGCGGTQVAASGEISSLDINRDGKYESNAACLWKIIGTDQQAMQITFSEFNIEPSPNGTCNYDFVEIRDGINSQDPVIGRFCGNTLPPTLKSSTNKISLVFHSDGKINLSGFRATYASVPTVCGNSSLTTSNVSQILTSPNFPSNYPPNLYCRWHFVDDNWYDTQTLVTFTEMDVSCDSSYIEIHTEDMINPSFRHCGSSIPHSMIAVRRLWISFHSGSVGTGRGFSLTYKIAECDRNYTSGNGVIMSPRYPYSFYDRNCTSLIEAPPGHTISLFFGKFYLHGGSDRICERGNLTVYDGDVASAPSLGAFCGSTLPNPIFSTGNKLLLRVAGNYYSGSYFLFYSTTDQGRGCGGTLNHVNGTISSPLYPNNYNKSTECRWKLSVPSHHTMTLTFDFFSLSSTSGCEMNYVELYEGFEESLSNRIGRFCSNQIPAPHTSLGNQMMVKMVTNSTNVAPGFIARFGMNKIDLSQRPSSFVLESSPQSESVSALPNSGVSYYQ